MPRSPITFSGAQWSGTGVLLLALGAAAFFALRAGPTRLDHPAPSAPSAPAAPLASSATAASLGAPSGPGSFVGSQACQSCHATQAQQWLKSHHAEAMMRADERSVRGDFAGASLDYFGQRTRFFRDGRRFVVATLNQRGQTETFEVAYTLGVEPLQQYLVVLPDGRVQALPFAWDSRPSSAGGQRWFHLYPDREVGPSDPLFWTRPQQNWNHMCAECHTTNFAKGYSASADRFESTFTELGAGCESCHGPGSVHVALMTAPGRVPDSQGAAGPRTHALGIATPRQQADQIEKCGICHARRVRLEHDPAEEALHRTWTPELLQEGHYFVDGQIQDEVFELGSFLQSKMASVGVTCSNCHDPHTARLKAEGNALCAQCHKPERYDTPRHHFHPIESKGAACVECHMPQRTYMVVDPRRDHRLAVPRPDLSDALGTPNACTGCHQDKTNTWASAAIERQRAGASSGGPEFARVHRAVREREPTASAGLRALLEQLSNRPLLGATALSVLSPASSPANLELLEAQLKAPEALVRIAALRALAQLPAPARFPLLRPLLGEEVRAVRHVLAPLLAGIDRGTLGASERQRLEALFIEYLATLDLTADRAESWVTRAGFQLAERSVGAARASFERALSLDETSLSARLNFADYLRATGDEDAAERLLRKACVQYPESGAAHFAIGLLLVRKQRLSDAVAELARAAQLEPGNSHFAYVHAVSRYTAGDEAGAVAALVLLRRRFPTDEPIQAALTAYCAAPSNDSAVRRACAP